MSEKLGMYRRVLNAIQNKTDFSRYTESFLNGGDLQQTDSEMMKYSAVFACTRVLAETYASVTINEFKRIDNGDDRKKTNDTGLLDLLKNTPNGYMNAYNYHEMSMVQINTDGNFYAIKDKDKLGNIERLRPVLNVTQETVKGEITYKTSDETYTRDKMFHMVGFSPDGIQGYSPLEYFSSIVNVGLTYQEFSKKFYKNGAFPSGVFEHEKFLNEEAYNRLQEDIKKRYSGLMNVGTPMLLEDSLKYKPITIKPVDAQLLESKKFQIEDICRVYRVPLHMVQNLDSATYNNIEHLSLSFLMYTMLPHFRRSEMTINTQLLTREQRDEGYYFEFNMASLLRGDTKSMAEAFAAGRQWGWMSVNDIRRLLNMNSIPNGDIYLEPMNMNEAGKTAENKQMVNEIQELIKRTEGK
jgi:HK97 family phage portal protein